MKVADLSDVTLAVKRVAVRMALRDCPEWRKLRLRVLRRKLDVLDGEIRSRKLACGGTD